MCHRAYVGGVRINTDCFNSSFKELGLYYVYLIAVVCVCVFQTHSLLSLKENSQAGKLRVTACLCLSLGSSSASNHVS